jgi:transposase
MPRKGFRAEEIIAKLREADVLLGQGKKVAEVVKALGVSEVTYYPTTAGARSTGACRSRRPAG